MRESLPDHTTKEDMIKSDHGTTSSTPRWVKVSVIIAIVLFLLVAIMLVFGEGHHGPGRHFKSNSVSLLKT
jgi:hypothetical protein